MGTWGEMSSWTAAASSMRVSDGAEKPRMLDSVCRSASAKASADERHIGDPCPCRSVQRESLIFVVGAAGLGVLVMLGGTPGVPEFDESVEVLAEGFEIRRRGKYLCIYVPV